LASILTSGLLGEQYIGVRPGADDEMLKNNGLIRNTSSAVVLEEMIGKMISSKAENPQ
jgi:phospholipid/cholesterol/gamma-HCH transport system substrate-binding protein